MDQMEIFGRIPKYDQVPMNSKTIASQLVFKNPEIIDNIHFFRPSLFGESGIWRK